MATASISKLGSLLLGPNGTIDVGPLPASFGFEGPFSSDADYFLSWAAHAKFGNVEFLRSRQEDSDRLRTLKQEAISFPSRLKSAMATLSRNPTTDGNRYPIVHRDFLLHNILFDDTYNVVGVIDWEFAHSAPLEVFAALTNMYSRFDSTTMHAEPDMNNEGKQYIEDIIDEERGIRHGCLLSETFGSILGDIGLCMIYFEEGRAVLFGELVDRYEKMDI